MASAVHRRKHSSSTAISRRQRALPASLQRTQPHRVTGGQSDCAPRNTLASLDNIQPGPSGCLDMIAAHATHADAYCSCVRCCSAQGLRTGGGSGAFSPVHPTPKDSLGAAAAAHAAFVSSPRALVREPPFSGQLTGPGGKGSSSMFVGPSRPRSAAARALLAGTTLHPVVQLGWQPLCEVHCNGCAPCT